MELEEKAPMALPWPSWLPSSLDTVKTKTKLSPILGSGARRAPTDRRWPETIVSARLGNLRPASSTGRTWYTSTEDLNSLTATRPRCSTTGSPMLDMGTCML